jgi:Undecaprenyl-phosphate galactose phosphotransferase WbaP
MLGFRAKPANDASPSESVRVKTTVGKAPGKTTGPTHSAFSTVTHVFPDFQTRLRSTGRWILLVDVVALLLALIAGAALAWALRALNGDHSFQELSSPVTLQQLAVYGVLGFTSILWLDSRGHYRQRLPFWEAVGHVLSVSCMGLVASGFFEFAARNNSSRLWIAFSWVLFAALSLVGRALARRRMEKSGMWQIPAIMIGEGPTAQAAQRALLRDRHVGFTIVECMPPAVLSDMNKTRAWQQILMLHDAHYIFLALEGGDMERYHAAIRSLPRARVPCSIIPPWLGLPSTTLTPHHFMMQDVMMLHDTNRLKLPLPRLIKRVTDIAIAGTALFLTLPIFLAVAVGVRGDGGPAFFSQPRVGRNGQLFNCYKFRSMRADADAILARHLAENPDAAEEWSHFQKLKNDIRITRFGQFIRRTSLDELPQLLNVLKGDMSLVGPRPCMPGQESLYAEDFSFYEAVRPGISGPWQVSGRSQLTFKERVALEAWYARNWSLWLDIVIMLKTVPTILKKESAF